MQVTIAGQTISLRQPARKWRRIWRSPAFSADQLSTELWGMAALGLCWRGPRRPADGVRPYNVFSYGERVLDELLARGATDEELDLARQAAIVVMTDDDAEDVPRVNEVAEAADFSGPADGSSETR